MSVQAEDPLSLGLSLAACLPLELADLQQPNLCGRKTLAGCSSRLEKKASLHEAAEEGTNLDGHFVHRSPHTQENTSGLGTLGLTESLDQVCWTSVWTQLEVRGIRRSYYRGLFAYCSGEVGLDLRACIAWSKSN